MKINTTDILYATIILVILITFANILYLENQNSVVETWEYDMFLTVSNYTGFNVDNNAIFFGTVKPGGTSSRKIQLNNNDLTLKVSIYTDGDLAKWVYTEQSSFILYPKKEKVVNVKAFVPKDAKYGDYEGRVIVKFETI